MEGANELAVEEPYESGGDDDEDGGDAEGPDEEGGEDGYPNVGPGDAGGLRHAEGGH